MEPNSSLYHATDNAALFPIGTVSELTGVNTVTLRAWERRHGLLKPHRTPKGHRLYSQQDVERVKQVLLLLEQGIPVGRVRAALDSPNLPTLPPVTPLQPQGDDPWQHYRTAFLRFIRKLDARALEHVFNEASNLYSLEIVAKKLLLPLYQELQEQQQVLPSTTADHAFLHDFLCIKLGARYLQHNSRATGRRLLVVNLHGARVQLHSLLLANTLSQHGYQVSLCNGQVSLDHLPVVLERAAVDALLLPQTFTPTPSLIALVRFTRLHTLLCGNPVPLEGGAETLPIHWLPEDLSEVNATVDQVFASGGAAA